MRGGKEKRKKPIPGTSITDTPSSAGDVSSLPFSQFVELCELISAESSYNKKKQIIATFLRSKAFTDDLLLWVRNLLPGVSKRVYHLDSKLIAKLFARVFECSEEEIISDLDHGDVARTVEKFCKRFVKPASKGCSIALCEIDSYLEKLCSFTKAVDQEKLMRSVVKRTSPSELRTFVRLLKHDLRINAGAKHVLEALDASLYSAFQTSMNLPDIIKRFLTRERAAVGKPNMKKSLSAVITLGIPVLPMLAEACRSLDAAIKKFGKNLCAEIKYDGERVQLHKKDRTFSFFSRSLKPVTPHKVKNFEKYIPDAFKGDDDLILDAEVLLVRSTGEILPFGTLGVHKKNAFADANVCLFVFDCLYINGATLIDRPLRERKQILREHMNEVENRVMFSEEHDIEDISDLRSLLSRVFSEGLEGIVLKDYKGVYEPGKRHWLKVKKDYLDSGAMADSADLVVLGAYFGSGSNGSIMSVFLMGCHDPGTDTWLTVCKVGNGFDNETLSALQKELSPSMTKISKDFYLLPPWLKVSKSLTPDFVVKDPKKAPVWEITGTEFSKAEVHTACGFSIRFPRVTRVREDKGWSEATNLQRLQILYEESKKPVSLGGDTRISPVVDSDVGISRKRVKDSGDAVISKKKKIVAIENVQNEEPCSSTSSNSSKLPNVFEEMTIYLSPKLSDFAKLKRYIIAYNGLVTPIDEAADVVVLANDSEKTDDLEDAVCVTVQWLYACFRTETIHTKSDFSI